MGYSEYDVESGNTEKKRSWPEVRAWDLVCIFFIGISIVFITLISLDISIKYEKTTCQVLDVQKPKVCPSSNMDHWTKCSCGSRCKSYNPCVNLRVITDINDEIYDLKETQNKNTPCTFFKKECIDHSGSDFNNKLEYANNTYNKYINTTMSCYFSNDENFVFIEKEYIVHYIMLGLFVIGLIVCCLCEFCLVRNKSN